MVAPSHQVVGEPCSFEPSDWGAGDEATIAEDDAPVLEEGVGGCLATPVAGGASEGIMMTATSISGAAYPQG